jgi:hypothetical protein
MLRTIAASLLVALAVTLAGCAGSTSTATTSSRSTPVAKAAGSWWGYAGTGATSVPVALTLRQAGANVTGNIDVAGRPDLTGPVVGTVEGDGLQLALQSGFGSLPLMTVSQDRITGTIAVGPMSLRRSK